MCLLAHPTSVTLEQFSGAFVSTGCVLIELIRSRRLDCNRPVSSKCGVFIILFTVSIYVRWLLLLLLLSHSPRYFASILTQFRFDGCACDAFHPVHRKTRNLGVVGWSASSDPPLKSQTSDLDVVGGRMGPSRACPSVARPGPTPDCMIYAAIVLPLCQQHGWIRPE